MMTKKYWKGTKTYKENPQIRFFHYIAIVEYGRIEFSVHQQKLSKFQNVGSGLSRFF